MLWLGKWGVFLVWVEKRRQLKLSNEKKKKLIYTIVTIWHRLWRDIYLREEKRRIRYFMNMQRMKRSYIYTMESGGKRFRSIIKIWKKDWKKTCRLKHSPCKTTCSILERSIYGCAGIGFGFAICYPSSPQQLRLSEYISWGNMPQWSLNQYFADRVLLHFMGDPRFFRKIMFESVIFLREHVVWFEGERSMVAT